MLQFYEKFKSLRKKKTKQKIEKIENFSTRSTYRGHSLPGSACGSAYNSLSRILQKDLLMAADDVTNAMSSLVRNLNSGTFFVRHF